MIEIDTKDQQGTQSSFDRDYQHTLRQKILEQNLLVFLFATFLAGMLILLFEDGRSFSKLLREFSPYVLINVWALAICRRGNIKVSVYVYTILIVIMDALSILVLNTLPGYVIVGLINLVLLNGFIVGARGALVMTGVSVLLTGTSSLLAGSLYVGAGYNPTELESQIVFEVTLLATGFVMASGINLQTRFMKRTTDMIDVLESATEQLNQREHQARSLAHFGELVVGLGDVKEILRAYIALLTGLEQLDDVHVFDESGKALAAVGELPASKVDIAELLKGCDEGTDSAARLLALPEHSDIRYVLPLRWTGHVFGVAIIRMADDSQLSSDEELFLLSATGIANSALKRVLSEQQLVHSQRMETVGRLAGGIAHDFNNMITAILGGSEMALTKVGEEHPARQHLQVSHSAALQAASLVNKLLTYARALPRQTEVLDLGQFVLTQEQLLRSFVGENAELNFDIADSSLWVDVDPVEIEQVISNLLLNARDAAGSRGRILMSLELVPGDIVRLSVADDGPGIAQDDVDRIFEPFYTSRRDDGGTGLGLSTVRSIVQASHGTVRVGTSEWGGALLEVSLPRSESGEVSEAQGSKDVSPEIKPGRVLVVDDDPLVRETIMGMLDMIGLKSQGEGDGHSALQLLKDTPSIDLVVTDMVMPGFSGSEFIQALRAGGDQRPVVLMSGYDDVFSEGKSMAPEPDRRVQKPVTIDQLRDVVIEVQNKAWKAC